MRIRTRLNLMVLLPFGVVAFTAAMIFLEANREEAYLQKSRMTAEIVRGSLELNLSAKQYLLFQEERPIEQWRISSQLMQENLNDLKAGNREEQNLIDEMRKNHGRAQQFFSQVTESYKSGLPLSGVDNLLAERLTGQLTISLTTISNDAARLERLSYEQINSFRKRANLFIISFLLLLAISISTAAWLLGGRIRSGITSLDESMEIAASGNFDYRADVVPDDEIGHLSRRFGSMTDRLKEITVSRDELVKEIVERSRVEEERQQLSEELRHKVTELEASNREMESFIYSVSHDLRQPLRAIASYSQIVRKGLQEGLADREKGYLTRIVDNAEKMSHLIESMLKLSRVSRQEIKRERIDLTRMAQAVVSGIRVAHPEVCTEITIQGGLFAVADEGLMAAVLENLIGNACKFTARKEEARVEFGTAQQDGETIFFVSDNGAGFDSAYAENLFKPFHRLHAENEFDGTGIGLSIVERIIGRHGGRVWAEGNIGKGATFFFTLPPYAPSKAA